MKKIINYCSGGLGNRLKPLASCYAISQITGRKLELCWHPTRRCGGIFEKLFTNQIDNIEIDSLRYCTNVRIYSEQCYIDHDAQVYGNKQLQELSRRFQVIPLERCHEILIDDSDTIIVYDNGFLPGINQEKATEFFSVLQPNDCVKTAVASYCQENHINKSVIGVHARGTDFEASGVNAEYYLNLIKKEIKHGSKFLLCSDSKEYETYIRNALPHNVIIRDKSRYVTKADGGGSWVNNVETPHESVEEALVDMYVLAETDFKIYNSASTFAHLILEIIKSRN